MAAQLKRPCCHRRRLAACCRQRQAAGRCLPAATPAATLCLAPHWFRALLVARRPSLPHTAGLKKFLKKHAEGDTLAVLDAKLGSVIKEKLGINCLYSAGELRRWLWAAGPALVLASNRSPPVWGGWAAMLLHARALPPPTILRHPPCPPITQPHPSPPPPALSRCDGADARHPQPADQPGGGPVAAGPAPHVPGPLPLPLPLQAQVLPRQGGHHDCAGATQGGGR